MRKNKNITKRRRYKNRRRIIRGGTIDDDANELINSLSGYDYNSMADFLEKMKDDPQLKNALEKRSSQQFESVKSTCKYMETLDTFVVEMITTAVDTLRKAPSEKPKKQLTTESMSGLLPENANLDELINKFMEKYAEARKVPCLLAEGKQMTLSQRPQNKPNSRGQGFALRKAPLASQRGPIYASGVGPRMVGGSRRKNKKSKRTRRKQRGGDVFLIVALVVVAIVACCYIYTS
jgi:hypothetical protein